MMKTNLTTILTALLIVFTFSAHAQTFLWGAGSSTPAIDSVGRFASDDSTLAGAGWTATSIYDGNATSGGAAFWTWNTTGVSQGGYWGGRTPMGSPTQSDGTIIFDSDYLDNAGTAGNFGNGTSPAPHAGEVETTASFDLTGYADSAISIKVFTYLRNFQIAEFSAGLSVDGGVTWEDADLFAAAGAPGANAASAKAEISATFYTATAGATNLSNCKLRFKFDGEYYFAMVDDAYLVVADDYDFAISGPTAGNTVGDGYTTAYTSDYRYSPVTQQDLSNFFYTARVVNFGARSILPANNARIEFMIEKDDGAGGWTNVFSGTIPVDTLGATERVTPEQVDLTSLVGLDTTGLYRATYIAEHDLADANSDNDTSRHFFSLTGPTDPGPTYAYSKCRVSTTDGQVYANRPIFPGTAAGNVVTEFEYGSMFFFPNGTTGTTDSVILDSVDYRAYASNSTASTATSAPVNVRVYAFNDLNADGSLDADPASGELTLVGLGADTVPLTPGAYVARKVRIIDISTFGDLALLDDQVYYISLDQRNPQGLEDANGDFVGAWYGADELNYSINFVVLADPANNPRNTAPVRVADADATTLVEASNDFNPVGFGADIQPSIRLLLRDPITVNVAQVQNELNATMELFPNPASNSINLKVSFEEESGNVSYIITAMNGQIINMISRQNVTEEVYTLDVSELPQGAYFITVRSDNGVQTKRFIKK